jgi:plasmid stability protein
MPKVRTTLTIDEDVLRWVKIRAARTGASDSAVIEESLRRDLKLDVLDELWSAANLSEASASELALEAQHATRPRRQGSGARGR